MNKLKKISVLAVAGLTILGTTVFAGKTGKVYNTSQGLVLREEASKTSAALATIPNGTEVSIIEISEGEWYKVSVQGKQGYLFAEYVDLTEEQGPSEDNNIEEQPENKEVVENVTQNTTKRETKIYNIPLITSSTIGTIPENTQLNIQKTLNNWAYVSYNNVNGWIRIYNYNIETVEIPQEEVTTEQENTPEETPEVNPEETVQTTAPVENTDLSFTKGYINSGSVNIRKEPTTDSEIVTILILNTGVTIKSQTEEWYKITYGDYTGYVYKPLISQTPVVTNRGNEERGQENIQEQPVETPSTNNNTNTSEDTTTAPTLPSLSTNGEQVVSFAKQYLGYRYVLGGTTPASGFDCSGFIYYVFNSCGYSISRSLTSQANTGIAVSKSELQPGDIVIFNNTSSGALGHVGIYIGNGNMIHAANSKRGVVTDTINSGYYNTYYYSARRIAK